MSIYYCRLFILSEYLPVPAVSKISNIHCCPSISTCFLYESSIVGSYFSTKIDCTNWTVYKTETENKREKA